MGSPDYEACSLEELLDVERHIDREAYPERYEELQRQIRQRKLGIKPKLVHPKCPKCGAELEQAWVWPSTGEEIAGLVLLLVPFCWVFSFFVGVGCTGYKCVSCDTEFRASDVQT